MAIKASSQVSVLDVTDAYSVTLTSEAFTFVGDTSGAPSGLSCTTQVVAYCGTKQCSKVTIGTITCPTDISSTITNNNTVSPTITFTTTATITSACEATIPVTVDEITINKKFSFAVAKQGNTGAQGEPGIDFSQGKMLYTDPTFSIGTNSTALYYNSVSNGNITWVRSEKSSDNPISDTSYEMVCTNTGASSPGHGGFRFGNPSRANAVFIYRIIAKIPTGRRIAFATNTIGDKSSIKWLTSTDGTGKFTEYILRVECGGTGTFKATGYFYLNGGDFGTPDAPIKWYVAYATCFDMTDTSDVIDLKKTVIDQGSTLDVLNNKIESKVWSTDITTAKNDVMADTDNKLKNYSTTSEMNSAITQKANEITSTVSSTYTTKTELNNLEIGGRNLIQYYNIVQFGAGTIDKSNLNSLGEIIRNDTSTNGGFRFDSKDCYEPSSNYVLSGYITILSGTVVNFRILNGGKIGSFISFEVDGVSYGNPFVANFTAINDILNDKNEHYFELKYKSAATISEDTGYQYTYFQPNSNNATAVAYKLSKFCLQKGDKATVWSPEPEYIQQQITVATQTADKFNWLVQSGTSATDFTLTDRMAELTAEIISLNGNVKVNGDMLVDGTITGNKINIEDLFSKNITATNFNITGGSIQIQTSDASYSFLDLNAGSVWCHIEPGEFKVSNDSGQYSLMQGHMIKCGDDSGNSTYADPGILEISGDSNGRKTFMRNSYLGYQDTSGNYIYAGKPGNDIRVELYGNNYDYTNPPIIYIDNGNTATGGNGEWLIISTNAIEINGASISNHIVVWDIPWALGSTFGYKDVDWTNSIPKGFKTLSVIPTIIESDDWENNITVFTQTITNTGCRVIVNGTAAINITLRLTIIYTKNP